LNGADYQPQKGAKSTEDKIPHEAASREEKENPAEI